MRFTVEADGPAGMVAATPSPALATGPPAAKRIRQGSPQQEVFWAELQDGSGNVLLEARAGTGKSSSCREGMWRLLERDRSLAIRYCCFNKAIADEFAAACPPGVEVGTMHRFGLQALQASFGSKVEAQKSYTLLDQLGGEGLKRYVRKSVATLVSLAKNHGYRPDTPDLAAKLVELLDAFDVETYRQDASVLKFAELVLRAAAETTGLVDFDDMLWLPVVHGLSFPAVDFLFVDECQDLNPLQHELALLLCNAGRAVVVGDPYQAIYGWRGAATDSMTDLRGHLGAKVLYLTVTWRCPRSHVELARRLVPDFEAAPDAPEGTLETGSRDLIDRARPGDLVLCRANAPIVAACLHQVARRVPAVVRGRSIGEDLMKVLVKVERIGESPTVPMFLRNLALWRAQEVGRLEAKDGTEQQVEQVTDQCACLDAIAHSCGSPAEIPYAVTSLFADGDTSSRVTFSSVHRAKGSEAARVTYLQVPYSEQRDRVRPPQPWELQQRSNLRYVALTRSLDTLTLVA